MTRTATPDAPPTPAAAKASRPFLPMAHAPIYQCANCDAPIPSADVSLGTVNTSDVPITRDVLAICPHCSTAHLGTLVLTGGIYVPAHGEVTTDRRRIKAALARIDAQRNVTHIEALSA